VDTKGRELCGGFTPKNPLEITYRFGYICTQEQQLLDKLNPFEREGKMSKKVVVIILAVMLFSASIFTMYILASAKDKVAEVTLTTFHRLTQYENESFYVGTSGTAPVNAKDFSPELSSGTVFWKIEGNEQNLPVTFERAKAIYSRLINRIIFNEPQGIQMVSPDGKEREWLFKDEDALVLSMRIVNADSQRMALTVIDINSKQISLVGIDILTRQMTKFDIPKPTGLPQFIDVNTAVISIGKDIAFVEFETDGSCNFSVRGGASERGYVITSLEDELVFYSEDHAGEWSRVSFGETEVEFDQMLAFFETLGSHVWAIKQNGDVVSISTNGSKYVIEAIKATDLIGAGLCADGYWVATNDGTVKIFSQKGRKEMRIRFPPFGWR
jgi:hypothetical protein